MRWRVLDAQGTGEAEQAVLGDRVRKAAGNDVAGMGGRDIDDVADALLDHVRQHRPAAVPGAVEVDGETAAPVLVAHLQRVTEHIDPGTVDQHIHAAKALDGQVDQCLPLILGGDINRLGVNLRAAFAPMGGDLLDFVALDIGNDQPRLLSLETGNDEANALDAGDDHHLVLQALAVSGARARRVGTTVVPASLHLFIFSSEC